MPAVGDVVQLDDGSVGVISEELSAPPNITQWRVMFPDSRLDVSPGFIAQTLAAPNYQVGDTVEVWPHLGTIQSIVGADITVQLERAERIKGIGHIEWQPDVTVPLWRIIRDNDSRLERNW